MIHDNYDLAIVGHSGYMLKLHKHIIGQIWERIFESMSKNAMPVNEQNQ